MMVPQAKRKRSAQIRMVSKWNLPVRCQKLGVWISEENTIIILFYPLSQVFPQGGMAKALLMYRFWNYLLHWVLSAFKISKFFINTPLFPSSRTMKIKKSLILNVLRSASSWISTKEIREKFKGIPQLGCQLDFPMESIQLYWRKHKK